LIEKVFASSHLWRAAMLEPDIETDDLHPEDVHNAYPELPVLGFARTTVRMTDVAQYISNATIKTPVKRAAYVIFRNESAAGQNGINNNYIGLQADGDRQSEKWTPFFSGTCIHAESMTGKLRRFICFRDWKPCIDILADKVNSRGLYVGGFAHPYANMQVDTDDDWPLAYWREWVEGSSTAQIPDADKNDLLKQYRAAVGDFPSGGFVQSFWNLVRNHSVGN
jgi:hypothetical protein